MRCTVSAPRSPFSSSPSGSNSIYVNCLRDISMRRGALWKAGAEWSERDERWLGIMGWRISSIVGTMGLVWSGLVARAATGCSVMPTVGNQFNCAFYGRTLRFLCALIAAHVQYYCTNVFPINIRCTRNWCEWICMFSICVMFLLRFNYPQFLSRFISLIHDWAQRSIFLHTKYLSLPTIRSNRKIGFYCSSDTKTGAYVHISTIIAFFCHFQF